MTGELLRWVWLAVGILFLFIEGLTATLFLFPLALGAFAAAIVSFAGGSVALQFVVAAVVAVASTLAVRPLAKRLRSSGSKLGKVGPEWLEGSVGVVKRPVSHLGEGHVVVEAEEWRAQLAEEGPVVPEGARVRVLRTVGTRLIVQPVTLDEGSVQLEEVNGSDDLS